MPSADDPFTLHPVQARCDCGAEFETKSLFRHEPGTVIPRRCEPCTERRIQTLQPVAASTQFTDQSQDYRLRASGD